MKKDAKMENNYSNPIETSPAKCKSKSKYITKINFQTKSDDGCEI